MLEKLFSKSPISSARQAEPVHEKTVEDGTEKKPQKISRRSFMVNGVKWALLGRAIALGGVATAARSSEREFRKLRSYAALPEKFWIYTRDFKLQEVQAETAIPVMEQSQPAAHVIDCTTSSAKIFDLTDIPDPDAAFPALVLYSRNHIDDTSEIANPVKRLFVRFKDSLGADRMLMVVTKNPKILPGIVSQYESDVDIKNMSFFTVVPDTVDNLKQNFATYFPEFPFSDELIEKINSLEVFVYWRNFGSEGGHGQLPDVYLIK